MSTLRLCEWSSVRADAEAWPRERREAVHEAAAAWQAAHRLNALPLEWSGPDGCTLRARQWVGVVEVEDARVEIYPKTDAALLHKNAPDEREAQNALHALLRLIEASSYRAWVEAGPAALAVAELTFVDLWACLLARHLWPQLRRGLPSAYLAREDALTTVRGQILVGPQLAHFHDRVDHVVCAWDEFSPDTALLRLFKCACHYLRQRAQHPLASGLLGDCLFMLDEVADVSDGDALRGVERMTWTRATERFRPGFELARRILLGQGPHLHAGEAHVWVFLVDMNRVFEAFCHVALEDRLNVAVEEQQSLGWLLHRPYRSKQLPDYLWNNAGQAWIGDAKWKLLEGDLLEEEDASEARLGAADVRQLTTYAELLWRQCDKEKEHATRPELAIFYPGLQAASTTQVHRTWNETRLHLVPVRVTGWSSPQDALPAEL